MIDLWAVEIHTIGFCESHSLNDTCHAIERDRVRGKQKPLTLPEIIALKGTGPYKRFHGRSDHVEPLAENTDDEKG